jgi:hypothetical protein
VPNSRGLQSARKLTTHKLSHATILRNHPLDSRKTLFLNPDKNDLKGRIIHSRLELSVHVLQRLIGEILRIGKEIVTIAAPQNLDDAVSPAAL